VPVPSSVPDELLPEEVLPVPPVEVIPVVVEVVPANRKPERIPVTARLATPIAVVIPIAARRPVDLMSITGPPSRRLLIPACSGILSASLFRMGGD